MLAAYRKASDQLAADRPGCHLPWELLAGIGKVESNHAVGRPIDDDGTITRPIIGVALDGHEGRALIRDTDHGTLDHDTTYDRAVGPMQFIPTTWRGSGRDGSGDHRNDPHNIHDATLAAGHYLCAANRDLTRAEQLRAAIFSYNPSDSYVRAVLGWMTGYQSGGATPLPSTSPSTGQPAPDDLLVIPLTPRAVPTGPASSPDPTESPRLPLTDSGSSRPDPSETGPAGVLDGTPTPSADCPTLVLLPADLTVEQVDLDPAIPGYEALDISTSRAPNVDRPLTIRAEVRTTAGQPVTTVQATLAAGSFVAGRPTLLARILGVRLAAADLADRTLSVALTIESSGPCASRPMATVSIRGVDPRAFSPPDGAPGPSAPTDQSPPPSATESSAPSPPLAPPAPSSPTSTPMPLPTSSGASTAGARSNSPVIPLVSRSPPADPTGDAEDAGRPTARSSDDEARDPPGTAASTDSAARTST